MRLWLMLVGDVSVKKTPIINAATKALMRFQVKQIKEYEQELAEYDEQRAEWDKKSGDPQPEKPVPPPRYITGDTTVEKLGEILRDLRAASLSNETNLPAGSAQWRSTGAASGKFRPRILVGGIQRRSDVVDRIRRGTQAVENLSASILGGIQPDKLAEIHGLTNDGLLQRFIPVMTRGGRFRVDTPADTSDYDQLIERLMKMKPVTVILADDAPD